MKDATKFETRELAGNLKKSTVKTKENQPDMFGECRINGVLYDISGWTKLAKSGNKYLSLAFQDKEKYKAEMQEKAKTDNNPNADVGIQKSDLPF